MWIRPARVRGIKDVMRGGSTDTNDWIHEMDMHDRKAIVLVLLVMGS